MAYGETRRRITFNGRALTPEQQSRLDRLERQYNARIPNGAYWYVNRWGGPGIAILQPGLELGGPMPANCSGGRTGTFINGRELHPADIAVLSQLSPNGQVLPGRFWVNAWPSSDSERASGQATFWTETRVPATHTKWLKIPPREADKPFGVRDGEPKSKGGGSNFDPCSPSSEL